VRADQLFRSGRKCPKNQGFGAEQFTHGKKYMVAEQLRL
jgi:hypothetical protein